MIKIVVNGIFGRMGQALQEGISGQADLQLAGGIDTRPAGQISGIPVSIDPHGIVPLADVVIDFSLPGGAMVVLEACKQHHRPLVTGTTGLNPSQMQQFISSAASIPIVQAFNFSIGINLLLKLLGTTARALAETADVEIVETHHRMKKDAPSGTAVMLAGRIAEARGDSLDEVVKYGRHGKEETRQREIGVHSVRGGSVIGEHSVYFLGGNENLILTHQALNRKIFVDGALQAARWIAGKNPGLYSMQDVLDFNSPE